MAKRKIKNQTGEKYNSFSCPKCGSPRTNTLSGKCNECYCHVVIPKTHEVTLLDKFGIETDYKLNDNGEYTEREGA